jgi:hypothetical protein
MTTELYQEKPHERLAKMLELAFGPYNERRKEIVASLPREMSVVQDGQRKTIQRELLLTEAIEPTGLLQTDVALTVAEGANQAKCWMNVLPVYQIKGNAYNHAYGEAGMYAAVVAEGAEFPNRSQDYGNAAFSTKKYAQSPKISNEMIEDARVDVIAQEIMFAGKAVQNSVEQKINDTMIEGSGNAVDCGGSNLGVKAIVKANAKLRGSGFNPDVVVMHPDLEGQVGLDLAPSYNIGAQGMAGNGMIPQGYLGIRWERCGIADVAGGTYTFGYDTNDYIGGLVIDSSRAGGIAVSRPLTVDEFDGSVRDIKGINVSMRMDAKSFVSTAACRIQY